MVFEMELLETHNRCLIEVFHYDNDWTQTLVGPYEIDGRRQQLLKSPIILKMVMLNRMTPSTLGKTSLQEFPTSNVFI